MSSYSFGWLVGCIDRLYGLVGWVGCMGWLPFFWPLLEVLGGDWA